MVSRKSTKRTTRAGGRKATKKRAPYVVFISHSTVDLWVARQMAKEIQNAGAKAWLDELSLEAGAKVRDEILKGIDNCREAVVLVTAESIKSEWVIFEIAATLTQRKRVTPILYNVPHEKLKVLADIKSLELNNFDQFLSQLRQRVKR